MMTIFKCARCGWDASYSLAFGLAINAGRRLWLEDETFTLSGVSVAVGLGFIRLQVLVGVPVRNKPTMRLKFLKLERLA